MIKEKEMLKYRSEQHKVTVTIKRNGNLFDVYIQNDEEKKVTIQSAFQNKAKAIAFVKKYII